MSDRIDRVGYGRPGEVQNPKARNVYPTQSQIAAWPNGRRRRLDIVWLQSALAPQASRPAIELMLLKCILGGEQVPKWRGRSSRQKSNFHPADVEPIFQTGKAQTVVNPGCEIQLSHSTH